jgi:predicted DNA-binding protein (MmcQ/YjbR family)
MNIEQLRDCCLQRKEVTEHFPFDTVTLVFKVFGKIFALIRVDSWEKGAQKINLKCDPDRAIILRETYEGIVPGWHSNKRLWNTVTVNTSDIPSDLLRELIHHSYDLVAKGLPKKLQMLLENQEDE